MYGEENIQRFFSNKLKKANEFQLSIAVTGFEAKIINKEEVIFYKIELFSSLTNKDWIIIHRYNEFFDLFSIFNKYFYKTPSLPSKSLSKVSNMTELNSRKESLNTFLNEIISRPDLLSNPNTIKFLKLENHFPDLVLFQPLLIYSLDDLSYPITAFHYDKKTSLLFLGISNSSISGKINNYFSKIFSGNNSKNLENTPGFLLIYNIIKNNSGAHHFELIFEKGLVAEAASLNFFSTNNILCVGMSNGNISLNKIFVNESSKISKELVEEICLIKAHKKRILGVCINFNLGYVYSIAKEGNLIISEMNYGSLMKTVPVSKKEVTAMYYDEIWGRLFITDEIGSISILDITTNPLIPKIIQALHNQISHITVIEFDIRSNILFIGNKNGIVITYTLDNYDEKIIPQYHLMSSINFRKTLEIQTDPHLKITGIKMNSRNEIMISLSNGAVAVYSHEATNPEFVLDAHTKEISGMFWDDEKKMLLTVSLDKSIKFYQFPIFWPSEMIRKSSLKNNIHLITQVEKEEKGNEHLENRGEEVHNKFREDKDVKVKDGYNSKNNERTESYEDNYYNEDNQNQDLKENKNKLLKLNKEENRVLTVRDIQCHDLDGWDNEF